jgi:hypothetical protein
MKKIIAWRGRQINAMPYIPARASFLARKRRYTNDDNDEPEGSWIGLIVVGIIIVIYFVRKYFFLI